MPTDICATDEINELRRRGYVVVVFTPYELQGVSPDFLEEKLVDFAMSLIESTK